MFSPKNAEVPKSQKQKMDFIGPASVRKLRFSHYEIRSFVMRITPTSGRYEYSPVQNSVLSVLLSCEANGQAKRRQTVEGHVCEYCAVFCPDKFVQKMGESLLGQGDEVSIHSLRRYF